MTTALISARGITRAYRSPAGAQAVVLDDVDLEIEAGSFTCLTGPSGSGKSTLLHCLSGLDRPDRGRVRFDGVDLGELDDRRASRLRRERMGFVFQYADFLDELSVGENVLLPALARRGAAARGTRRWVDELFERLGVGHLRDSRPAALSGGERQRAGICRALVNRPDVVFADEPTGALHRDAADAVVDLFAELHTGGTTVVLVTHDPVVAERAGIRHHLLDGRIDAGR
jgi:putative ABC transport system ATP-binding protein